MKIKPSLLIYLEEALAAKADISEIPNFTSDLINDSKFVTSSDLLAENVGYDSTTVKDTLDSLLYEAINITSFTSNVEPVQEIGTNINSITLTWKLSQPATEQFINDVLSHLILHSTATNHSH